MLVTVLLQKTFIMITVEYTVQAHWKKKVIFISINANKTGKDEPKEQNKNENLFHNDMLSERNKPGELSVSM